jgi:hypothetical protein
MEASLSSVKPPLDSLAVESGDAGHAKVGIVFCQSLGDHFLKLEFESAEDGVADLEDTEGFERPVSPREEVLVLLAAERSEFEVEVEMFEQERPYFCDRKRRRRQGHMVEEIE